jgi:hypothetical protein
VKPAIALVKPAPPPAPRVMRIRILAVKGGFEVRKECEAGHHYAAVIYTAAELDELADRIREARGGAQGGNETGGGT